jgi:hypothetical protein
MGKRPRFFGLVTALVAVLALTCRADAPSLEYQVKAAFLYNFTQFVTWPKESFSGDSAPFVVAVIGNDPFSGALEQAMENKTVHERPIVIKHFASVDDLGSCQILFVPAAEDDSLSKIMTKLGTSAVLTVGESESILTSGGGIRLYPDGNKIRFEISPGSTDRAGLKVSAKLMKLAHVYDG